MRVKELEFTHRKRGVVDAQAGLGMLETENFDGLVSLGMNRLESLRNFPDADPSDTQRLTQLAVAARNGSEEARDLLKSELSTAVDLGRALGVLQEPEIDTKVVGNFLVNDQTGAVVFDASDEGPREKEKDANGRLRYVDDGELVFPQIEILEEEISNNYF